MTYCPPPTICSPRCFWSYQKLNCTNLSIDCLNNSRQCQPQDMTQDDAGLMKKHWLSSVIYQLLGTDAADNECWDQTRVRRGDPADAFRNTESGNHCWRGYKGSSAEQLALFAADIRGQISAFLKKQGIAADVKATVQFAGTNQQQIAFTIAQTKIGFKAVRQTDTTSFIWQNL